MRSNTALSFPHSFYSFALSNTPKKQISAIATTERSRQGIIAAYSALSKFSNLPITTPNKFHFSSPLIKTPRFQNFGPSFMTSQSNLQASLDKMTFVDFIHQSRTKFVQNTVSKVKQTQQLGSNITLIMGNEAADADSIISALTLAYIMEKFGNQDMNDVQNFVPLIPIPKKDISLRRDVTLLLQCSGIDHEELLYLDDTDPSMQTLFTKSDPYNVNIILTDHNAIRKELSHLADQVTSIFDHHEDEGKHLHLSKNNRIIAFEDSKATVGSTCTLVTERIIEETMGNDCDQVNLDYTLSLPLMATILLDTVNCNSDAGKVTARDERAIEYLLKSTNWLPLKAKKPELFVVGADPISPLEPDPTRIYNWLSNAKFDLDFWLNMSSYDNFRIDYKNYYKSAPSHSSLSPGKEDIDSFGLSSVLLPLHKLLEKPDFEDTLLTFMQEKQIPVLGVLSCVVENDVLKRSMLLVGINKYIFDSIVDFLLNGPEAAILELSKEEGLESKSIKNGNLRMLSLKQGNPKGSRKQVAPIMLEFVNQIYKERY